MAEAKREALKARFDLLVPEAMIRVARRLHKGGESYGDPLNYRKGLVDDKNPINHALGHLFNYLEELGAIRRGETYDFTDDHLAAAIANIMFEIYYDAHNHCYEPDGRLRDDYMIVDGEPVQINVFDGTAPAEPTPAAKECDHVPNALEKLANKIREKLTV